MIEQHADETPATPGSTARSSRKRKAIVAGTAVAVLATGVSAAAWARGGSAELPLERPSATFGLTKMEPGKTAFSLGSVRILEPGKEVRIVSVKAAHSDNIEYLGAIAVWPRDHQGTLFTGGPGFPNLTHQKKHHPVDEVIPASETAYVPPRAPGPMPVGVTLGFRLLSGAGAVNGVTIVYKADGKTKREHFRHAVVGCVKPEPCDTKNPEFSSNLLRRLGLIKD